METSGKGFRFFSNLILILLCISCLLPLLLLFMSSITTEQSLVENGYSFFPKEIGFDAYLYLWTSRAQFVRAYEMTFLSTIFGTTFNLLITVMMAYPLSRKSLPGRSFFSLFIFITMLFHGGLIPTYLTYSQTLHIKDTFWALTIPSLLMNGFGVIITRTYFTTNIPDEIIEASRIDGAGELRILYQVVIPMAKPIIATNGLMAGLAYWNDWLNGMYYLSTRTDLYTIQNLLNRIITSADFISNNQANALVAGITVPSVGVRMAVAIVAILPILIIYPFFQGAFVKGIVVGGVKG